MKKHPIIGRLISRIAGFAHADSNFSEILSGSFWVFGAQVIAAGIGLVTSVIIARVYGAEIVGILSVVQALMMFAASTSLMGTNTLILRLVPEHISKFSVGSAFQAYRKIAYIVGGVSLVVGTMLLIGSEFIAERIFGNSQLKLYCALTAGTVIFKSLMDLTTETTRGLRLIKTFALMRVLPTLMMLVFLAAMVVLRAGAGSPIYAQLLAWACTAIFGGALLRVYFKKWSCSKDAVRNLAVNEILEASAPMFLVGLMIILIGQVGIILLGMFGSAADVGFYSVAVRVAGLVVFVLTATNSLIAPKISELYYREEMAALIVVARKSARLIFWSTAPILLVLLIFGRVILSFFYGGEFAIAYPALILLILGQFVNAMAGSTGIFMNMTGNQKVFRNIIALAALVAVVVSAALIPRFGIIGAAVATALSTSIWNLVTLIYIKRKYGFTTGYVPFLTARIN